MPALFLFTDPSRMADPEAAIEALPPGTGVIYRAFGASDARETGLRLLALCRRRRLLLLVGADVTLAESIKSDGVHMPERSIGRLPRLKARHPAWVVTAAAHSLPAARRATLNGADAVFVSTVFRSGSPSAGVPLGPVRLARIVRLIQAPVYALGGVSPANIGRLRGTGVGGFGAVEAFL